MPKAKSTALINPETNKATIPSAKVKDTVTYFRQQKFKNLMHQLAEETFKDENIPDIKLDLKHNARYKTTKQLNDDVKRFFMWCGDNLALPTVNSLSLYLGWYTELFYNYLKVDGCSQILKKAKDLMAYRLEVNAEETGNPGAMFLLKASHGYQEKQEVNVSVTLDVDKLYAKSLRSADKPALMDSATKKLNTVEIIDIEPSNDAGLQ